MFRTLDFNWILQGLDSGSQDLWIQVSKDFRISGFSRVLNLRSVDLRILVSDFDIGFGHLVFVDLVVLVCWYKDVKGVTQIETFSTKVIFCPTKEGIARRTDLGGSRDAVVGFGRWGNQVG